MVQATTSVLTGLEGCTCRPLRQPYKASMSSRPPCDHVMAAFVACLFIDIPSERVVEGVVKAACVEATVDLSVVALAAGKQPRGIRTFLP